MSAKAMAFEGNTRDLGSFGEEMDEITTLHQSRRRKGQEILETASQFLVTGSGRSIDGVRILVTASERNPSTSSRATKLPALS
ncbi:hypothetical protein Tco_0168658 [Tanacetum coccineum]